jgi:hypothetical protein
MLGRGKSIAKVTYTNFVRAGRFSTASSFNAERTKYKEQVLLMFTRQF